jgi:hypothetical protein
MSRRGVSPVESLCGWRLEPPATSQPERIWIGSRSSDFGRLDARPLTVYKRRQSETFSLASLTSA